MEFDPDPWWRHSPIFMRDQYRHYVSRPGAEFWFDNFWKPRILSAWAYELVRRMPRLQIQEAKTADKDLLASMPPYSRLKPYQKQFLYAVFSNEYVKFRSEWEMDNDQPASGDKPGRLWRQGQVEKLGDWTQIEILDRKYDPADKDKRDLAKKYIRRFWPLIGPIWRLIGHSDGEQLALPLPHPLQQHEFTRCYFSWAQFREAVRLCEKS